MVVLEGGGGVVTIGNNQYLQPDYLTPLSTTVSISLPLSTFYPKNFITKNLTNFYKIFITILIVYYFIIKL